MVHGAEKRRLFSYVNTPVDKDVNEICLEASVNMMRRD